MNRRRGFTLIETLIAMVLLAGALIVLGNAWSGSLGALRKSRSLTTLSLLLQRKITEYEIKYKDRPADVPETEEGDFGEDFASYRWVMASKQIVMPDLTSLLTARDGGAKDEEIMIVKQLTEIISNAVKELKLSIFWKVQDKELEYSVTTYIIDHDKAGLPGGGGAPANPGGTPAKEAEKTPGKGGS